MMKDALQHASSIRAQSVRVGAVLMLDFDGTLASIKPHPHQARMNAGMRRVLSACAQAYPTAVVTGRSLADVCARVKIREIAYAGNHGLEWLIDGKKGHAQIPVKAASALSKVRRQFRALQNIYEGVFFEDKKYSYCIHYRAARRTYHARIEAAVKNIVRKSGGAKHLRIVPGFYVLSILPRAGWDKGRAARMLKKRLHRSRNTIPIFIGDDVTDEDVFKAFPSGITILVGARRPSTARYHLKNVSQVEKFLKILSTP